MGRKGKNNESKKPPSKGPNKNNGSQKQAKGRKIDSVATGLNRIVKVTLTSDEQTMILDVLSSLSTYKKSNVSNLQEDNKALDKDGSDNDDDNNDGDDDEPNLDINPVSGFSVPILKRAPIDAPSKASKGRIYSQMNRFDQRGYIKKMVRDDRFRRRADERMEKQIRHDRYIENERLRLESIVLTDAPAAVADDAYASDANSAPCKAEADVIDDDENDENVEDDDGEDDDDVNDDEEEDEDDDDGGDDADDGDEDDQNTAEPSYWKPPNRHTQRTETEHSVGPLCIDPTLSITLKEKLEQYKFSPETAEMRTTKESLPIFQSKETILRMIGQNQVTVISGETGSGKYCTYIIFYFI